MAPEHRHGAEPGPEDIVYQQFPTTLLWRTYPNAGDLNAALARLVRSLRDKGGNAAVGTSTVGGFQTENDFLNLPNPAVATLRGMINNSLQAFLASYFACDLVRPPGHVDATLWGWAVLMRRSDYNMPHLHPEAHVSGVYYVEMPEIAADDDAETPGGSIVFYDPRATAEMYQLKYHRTQHHIVPTPGSIVVFPSYYRHAVYPYRVDGERISIAFNSRLSVS